MIEKMKFISITGPKADIDRVAQNYLSKYEIHLENALSELKTVQNLRPFMEVNPYKDILNKANDYLSLINTEGLSAKPMDTERAIEYIRSLDSKLNRLKEERNGLELEKNRLTDLLIKIEPFQELDYDIDTILSFKFIKFRFGKIAIEYYDKLERYMYENLDSIFYKCHSDKNYVWGVCFIPASQATKIDAIYSSMHFERLYLPDEYDGTPLEAFKQLQQKINEINSQIEEINSKISAELQNAKEDLYNAQKQLAALSINFDVRKLAACTNNEHQVFYILCGWMTKKDADAFQREIEDDPNVYCIIEDGEDNNFSTPPTKLKNPKIFKPFEMFIKMYGLPAYNEFDPTIFVAITYTFIFGCMFGDAGQGILLVIGGALLYKLKKMDLAAIISMAGIFSTIFGFLYGSLFGFEDVLPALWLKPMEKTITLPIVGSLNTVLVVAIAFGMGLILLSMVFNIINGIKQHNIEKIFFDTNGVAGLIFYGSAVVCIVLVMTQKALPALFILLIMFIIPLILIAFKEPLSALIEKKADAMPKEKGMFLVQSFFELFEVILSYMSNTISFVRIGAFALSHAGMMEVVLMLAGAENGGSPNWIVVVIGNLLVMGMEGLIVGIHVLRLEYYEMFSRFFQGSGREFVPYSGKQSDN